MISYKPLFRLLVDRDMTRTELRNNVGFSTVTLAKLAKNESVSLSVIESICLYLKCNIEDVVEILP